MLLLSVMYLILDSTFYVTWSDKTIFHIHFIPYIFFFSNVSNGWEGILLCQLQLYMCFLFLFCSNVTLYLGILLQSKFFSLNILFHSNECCLLWVKVILYWIDDQIYSVEFVFKLVQIMSILFIVCFSSFCPAYHPIVVCLLLSIHDSWLLIKFYLLIIIILRRRHNYINFIWCTTWLVVEFAWQTKEWTQRKIYRRFCSSPVWHTQQHLYLNVRRTFYFSLSLHGNSNIFWSELFFPSRHRFSPEYHISI